MKIAAIVWKQQKRLEVRSAEGRVASTATWTVGREIDSAGLSGSWVIVTWRGGSQTAYPYSDVDRLDLAAEAAKAAQAVRQGAA